MFGWGKKKDAAVVESVCTKLRPLFAILELRLGGLPRALLDDPYVVGYVVASATVFAQIETSGKASAELRGLMACRRHLHRWGLRCRRHHWQCKERQTTQTQSAEHARLILSSALAQE